MTVPTGNIPGVVGGRVNPRQSIGPKNAPATPAEETRRNPAERYTGMRKGSDLLGYYNGMRKDCMVSADANIAAATVVRRLMRIAAVRRPGSLVLAGQLYRSHNYLARLDVTKARLLGAMAGRYRAVHGEPGTPRSRGGFDPTK